MSIDFYNFINQYGTAMPPLLGTILLCIIRVDDKPLIKIDEAFKKEFLGEVYLCVQQL